MELRRFISGFLPVGVITLALALPCIAAQPTTKPAVHRGYYDRLSSEEERLRVLGEMQSGDPKEVAAACQEIHSCGVMQGHPHPWDLQLFTKVNRFDEVEPACIEGMLLNPSNSEAMAAYEMVRAKAFIAAGKPTEALSAAKAYYNLARLKDTADAIDVMSSALLAANPDGNDAARFRAQQLASVDEPTIRPSPDLGEPILASIRVDGSPFAKAIDGIRQNNYTALASKGNLLLAADRTKEARSAFEAAVELAGPPQLPSAIENVARAIRAETEEIGPANAYIMALRHGVH